MGTEWSREEREREGRGRELLALRNRIAVSPKVLEDYNLNTGLLLFLFHTSG